MTNENQAPGRLCRARRAICALAKRAAGGLSDAVGLIGLGLLGRGLWLQFGEAWALIAVGSILLAVSLAAALRGND